MPCSHVPQFELRIEGLVGFRLRGQYLGVMVSCVHDCTARKAGPNSCAPVCARLLTKGQFGVAVPADRTQNVEQHTDDHVTGCRGQQGEQGLAERRG